MADGRVMFAGGAGANGVVNTVDILGANGTFTAGPAMLTARNNAACATLQDGRVFVSGGNDGINALASAEYFTPSTGLWTSAGSMANARYGHTAVVDFAGAVLLAGGTTTGGGVTPQLEVFRPANNTFLVLGSLSSARTNYAIVPIDGHRTLIAGGSNGQSTLNTIDIFDAWTNAVTPSGSMLTARSGFGAATLYDGTVLFTGGFDPGGNPLATSEIYNPTTLASIAGPTLNTARGNHSTYLLPGNGSVVVFGGSNGTNAVSATEIYQPWTGKFVSGGVMNAARSGAGATVIHPGMLVAAGGQAGANYLAGSETYSYATVLTDKPDYHPGSVATFTGTGWQPGETVAINVTSFPVAGAATTTEFTGTAVANGAGQFSIAGFSVDKSHAGMRFLLTVSGAQSQAETTFTDGTDATVVTFGNSAATTPPYSNGFVSPCGNINPSGCFEPYGTDLTFGYYVSDVTNPGNTVTNGTVTVTDDNITLFPNVQAVCSSCSNTVVPGNNITVGVNDALGILGAGENVFSIQYTTGSNGTTTWLSSAPVTFDMNISAIQTSINEATPNPSTVNYGQQITLSATVTNIASSLGDTYTYDPQGTTTFTDNFGYSCSATQSGPLVGSPAVINRFASESIFTCVTPANLPVGTHIFTADYNGVPGAFQSTVSEAAILQGTTQVSVDVLAVATTTTIAVSPSNSPLVYPTIQTITATVAPVAGPGPVTGVVTFFDNGSAIGCGNVTLSGNPGMATSCDFILQGGTHQLTASYSNTGSPSFSDSNSGATAVTITGQPTSTTVGLSSSSGTFGVTNETFTATVSCASSGLCGPGPAFAGTGEGSTVGSPVGTVNFIDTSTNTIINPAPIPVTAQVNGTATATYSTNTLAVGAHPIAAMFTPTGPTAADWLTSTTTSGNYQIYTVNTTAATFSISISPPTSPGPSAFQALTFLVTANPQGSNTPTGSVQIVLTQGVNTLYQSGFVNLNNGQVTFHTPGAPQGTVNITLNYTSTSGNFSSATPVLSGNYTPNSFTVTTTGTTTTLTPSQVSPITYGTSETLTATVAPSTTLASGSPSPAGTVTFVDTYNSNITPLCSNVTVTNGSATCTPTPNLTAGSHSIVATFTDTDTNFTGSASAALGLGVNPATTTTAVSANLTTINLGGSVIYSVSVTGPVTTGAPVGTVTVTDGGTPITACTNLAATGTVNNVANYSCTATYNGTPPLTGGSKSIQANFTPNPTVPVNFAASTSTAITETVTPSTFTFGNLTTNNGASIAYNTPTNLRIPYTLGLTPPPAPTGKFQIFDGATLIASPNIDGNNPQIFALPASVIDTVGTHTLSVTYAGDANYQGATSLSFLFTVTKFGPTVTTNFPASVPYGNSNSLPVTVNVSGAGGGAAGATGTVTFTFGALNLGNCTLSAGTCTLTVTNAGLIGGADSIGVAYSGDSNYSATSINSTLNVAPVTPTASITTSPSGSAAFGAPVQITVSFLQTGAGNVGTPTGTAKIYDQTPPGTGPINLIGTVTLASGSASITTSALIAGSHTLSASFTSGDGNFSSIVQGSGPTVALTVNTGNVTVTVTPSPNPASINSTVTYNIVVVGGPTPPPGTVTLNDTISGGGPIATCTALALVTTGAGNTSTASCQVTYSQGGPTTNAGSHPITAVYTPLAGTTAWGTTTVSSPQIIEVVGAVTPTLGQPTALPTPGTYGVQLTYSVKLTPVNPSPAYGPDVQFYDNGVPLGTPQPVVAATGIASFGPTVPPPTGGNHSITAQFLGDGNYTASLISPKLVFTITTATPTVTIASPIPTSAPYDSMITTGAVTVAPPAGNNGVTPTGTVTLMVGTTAVATGTLSAGSYTFTNVQLPASLTGASGSGQSYPFFVTYSGDGNWATAQSSQTTLNITQAPATYVITSAQITLGGNNPVYGQSLTFTATFTGPGNPVSGTTSFQDTSSGGTNNICAPVTVTNNVATCTTNSLPLGSNTVSIGTLTDPNHSLATTGNTPLGPFTISQDTTSITLASNPNPSLPGQAFVLTATVTVPAPGTGALNGTVSFFLNGTTALCTSAALSSTTSGASATCNVAANTPPFTNFGQYPITATYSGGTNTANASVTINQQVSQPGPTFTNISSTFNPSVFGQTVTLTATFTVPGSTAPNGTVQFYDGPNTLGGIQAISLVSGNTYMTSITVPSGTLSAGCGDSGSQVLCAGNHSISALYIPGVGDAYASDNSATQGAPTGPKILIQVVTQASSSTSASVTPLAEVYATQGIPNAPVYAEQITFTAVIAPVAPATGNPTGFAIFQDAGTQFGPLVPLQTANGVTTVTITTSQGGVPNLGIGTHANITVQYLGDSNYKGSTSTPFPLIVISPAPTMTTVTTSASAQGYGTQLVITGKVCATQVNPSAAPGTCISTPFPGFSGTITFYDGVIGNATALNSGGTKVDPNAGTASITITLTHPPLAFVAGTNPQTVVGAHTILAVYSGDTYFAGSTTATGAPLTITPGQTQIVVTSNANPSVTGQPVVFVATVSAPGSFAVAPTGTVTFSPGIDVQCTAPLTANGIVATSTITIGGGTGNNGTPSTCAADVPYTVSGGMIITAGYPGDANYSPSSTPVTACAPNVTNCALVQVVTKALTTTLLSTSSSGQATGNNAPIGQAVTLTATVQVNQPGNAISGVGPGGTVVFTANEAGSLTNTLGTGTVICTGVNGCQATLTLTSLPVTVISITATYSGDSNYVTSTSLPLSQSVSKVQSQVSLVSSLNPSNLGMPVTYTVTVTPQASATPTNQPPVPTGAITLFDGSNVLADLTLVGGQTQYTAALAVGGHTLSASYPGDLNFQPSVSQPLIETVNKIQSTLNLTSSVPSGAVASQVITFTAQIQPTPPVGVAYPTGQVGFFMDGATQIGAASLNSGVATLTVTLPAGNHQIQAFYIGDNNWTGATSIYLAQVVGTATTSTQIVSSTNPSVFGQPVVVTITVAVPYPGTVPAAGTVQLYDNGTAIGNPLPANNGTFSTTLTSLAVGTHNLVAEFQATSSFSQSSSAALSQIVQKAPTVTTLAAFPNSSTSNQGVTLTAVVTVPAPGGTANVGPTGTVQFVNTTTSAILGSSPLNLVGGVWTATLNTSTLVSGSQTQLITATYSGDGNFATSTSPAEAQSVFTTQISVVNAAGYTGTNFAPNSFATIFGQNLAYSTATASVTPWPSSLAGTTVTVTDSNGVARLAPLYYVSLPQIDFIIPAGTAYGLATVTVTNASGENLSTIVLITVTSPGLFSENGSGAGVVAGDVLAVHSDGSQSAQAPLFQYNPNTSQFVPVPIVWTNATDQEYLVLYGTGIRGAAQSAVTATVGGISVPVIYAGAQAQYPGLDQINLGPLPMSLKGTGVANVVITVNGQSSNTVTVDFQ